MSAQQSFSRIPQDEMPQLSDGSIQFTMDRTMKRLEQEPTFIPKDPELYRESKGLFGLKNQVAARLSLPPLLPHYLFLARFPIKIMHCCIRRILCSTDISK